VASLDVDGHENEATDAETGPAQRLNWRSRKLNSEDLAANNKSLARNNRSQDRGAKARLPVMRVGLAFAAPENFTGSKRRRPAVLA
jgi:hypothetical protein